MGGRSPGTVEYIFFITKCIFTLQGANLRRKCQLLCFVLRIEQRKVLLACQLLCFVLHDHRENVSYSVLFCTTIEKMLVTLFCFAPTLYLLCFVLLCVSYSVLFCTTIEKMLVTLFCFARPQRKCQLLCFVLLHHRENVSYSVLF